MKQHISRENWFATVAVAAMTLSMIGCGGSHTPQAASKSSEAAQALSGKDQIKDRLKMIADTGSGGSAVSGMRTGLDKMKESEPQLAADLLKDLEKLEKLQNPAQIKAQAFAMLNKLSK